MKTSTPSFKPAWPESLLKSRGRSFIMGVLNATPDSFYAASRLGGLDEAVSRALGMVDEGADILDIGGQSTRPGSEPVPEAEEIRRVVPLVEALRPRVSIPISVDTDKAEVARLALAAGADIINDVSALRQDPRMAQVSIRARGVILMHRGGESSKTMQVAPVYQDVVAEVREFLAERLNFFVRSGGDAKRVMMDPGIGFGKTLEHNLALLKNLETFVVMGLPVVLGVSRKSFLGHILGVPDPAQRLEGSLAVACWAQLKGVAVLRVHDVKATRLALDTLAAVSASRPQGPIA